MDSKLRAQIPVASKMNVTEVYKLTRITISKCIIKSALICIPYNKYSESREDLL